MKNLIPTLLVIVITIISCNPSEPENDQELTLKVEDASCIEAWLNIQTNNISLPAQINLTANSSLINQFTLTTSDSLIVIDSLKPNSSYTFQASISNKISSNSVNAVTMDTTSHDFTWQTFTFGEHSSSILYDVAIIDENNIWAVGQIFLNDSIGQPDPHAYNAMHWDGKKWELKIINMKSSCNPVKYPLLKTIWSFSESNIVLTSGGSIGWFNGIVNLPDCSIRPLLTGSLNKLWGTSSNNIYAVGNEGNIVGYKGTNWRKIESGTTLDILDIYGWESDGIYKEEIICIASNKFQNAGKEVLRINGNTTIKMNTLGLSSYYSGIWFIPNRVYYVVGSGIFKKSNINSNEAWYKYPPGSFYNYYSNAIDGQGFNDIIIGGSFGELIHFNGSSWKNYHEEINKTTAEILSVTINEDTIVASGFNGSKAMIIVGHRQ